jgi:succinylarginine dihydrolase
VTAVEANADGLIGPTHNYAGLSPGNLASAATRARYRTPARRRWRGWPRCASFHDLGVPQFVLPPHERPDVAFLRQLGFAGRDADVLRQAWRDAPLVAGAAASASPMWAANAATVTPSADSADGRLHLTPANLLSNLHRSLEPPQTARALRTLLPSPALFTVHDPLPAVGHFADEGAANHVRLCAEQGRPGVNLFVYGREAYEPWRGRHPARQTLEASQAVARRHGAARTVFARQSLAGDRGGRLPQRRGLRRDRHLPVPPRARLRGHAGDARGDPPRRRRAVRPGVRGRAGSPPVA